MSTLGRMARYGAVAGAMGVSFVAGVYWQNPPRLRHLHAATAVMPMPPMPDVPGVTPDVDVEKRPSRASEIMQYGFPGFDNLRTFEDYVLSYDQRNRTAHWVVEHLSPSMLTYDPSVDRSKCQFHADESIHPYFRSQNEDYHKSGYDRGHLAAAGNHRRTQNSVDQTFLLSNISPQVGNGFNRDKWNELEKYVRSLARKNPNVYVCTGPLYLPRLEADGHLYVKYKVIGKDNVAVPTHFFKVILVEVAKDKFDLEAYVLPNEAIPDSMALASFRTPLDAIERAAGFLIFDKLPKRAIRNVNGKKAGGFW
ncbi:unnamed protein product [Toxocara canis]|uniref:Endonuclease n=1 Tax=Toxocara canis TaxID=6265 RepID=A0A183V5L5_TOXCA|nr:unnamed protein product [Toxocara canis]